MEDFTSFVTFRALKSVQYANGEETVTRLSQAVTANAIPLVSRRSSFARVKWSDCDYFIRSSSQFVNGY